MKIVTVIVLAALISALLGKCNSPIHTCCKYRAVNTLEFFFMNSKIINFEKIISLLLH